MYNVISYRIGTALRRCEVPCDKTDAMVQFLEEQGYSIKSVIRVYLANE